MPVMFISNPMLRVLQLFRLRMNGILVWDRIWRVHINLEIGDDMEVIPKLMLEICYVTQMRVQKSHHFDNDLSISISLLFSRKLPNIIHHILHISTVLCEYQLRSCTIVIESWIHNYD